MQRESTMLLLDNVRLINQYSKDSVELTSNIINLLDELPENESIFLIQVLRKNLDIQILAETSLRLIKTL